MPLKIVFSRPQNWSRLKTLFLKHSYRRQGCKQRSSTVSRRLPTVSKRAAFQEGGEEGGGWEQAKEAASQWARVCQNYPHDQGQVSAEGILHLVNPNLGSNSGMQIFQPRILGPNSGVDFFWSYVSNKKSPLKNSPSRNSPPRIHIKKFTPEFGRKNSHCISAGPFC